MIPLVQAAKKVPVCIGGIFFDNYISIWLYKYEVMNRMDWEQLAECHKALADKTRLRILSMLKAEELCVCELVEILHITQPAVSQHMRKLKNAKLVKERRNGQWVFYSLDGSMYPFFEKIVETLPDASEEIEQLKKSGLKVRCD